jgi:hypothetical protein
MQQGSSEKLAFAHLEPTFIIMFTETHHCTLLKDDSSQHPVSLRSTLVLTLPSRPWFPKLYTLKFCTHFSSPYLLCTFHKFHPEFDNLSNYLWWILIKRFIFMQFLPSCYFTVKQIKHWQSSDVWLKSVQLHLTLFVWCLNIQGICLYTIWILQ